MYKERLKKLSSKVFVAGGMPKHKIKNTAMQKIKKNFSIELSEVNTSIGMIRCRKLISSQNINWDIKCFGSVEIL